MLRLAPSEIAISPEDLRLVTGRMEARKKHKARVVLRLGPERAIQMRHDRNVPPFRAAQMSDELDDLPSLATTPYANGSIVLPVSFDGSEDDPSTTTATVDTQRQQLDGQVEIPSRMQPSRAILSAPSLPQVIVNAPTPHLHARHPVSDGAIALDHVREANRPRVPGGALVHTSAMAAVQVRSQRVMRVSFDVNQSHSTLYGSDSIGQSVLSSESQPLSHRLGRFTIRESSVESTSSSSGSSTASEAAAEDRLSPLEALSQQAALAHSRITARARRHRPRRDDRFTSHQHVLSSGSQETQLMTSGLLSSATDESSSRSTPAGRLAGSFEHRPLPIRSRDHSSSASVPPHPVPPRNSSRLHTPTIPGSAAMRLPRTRPTPPRNAAEIQRELLPPAGHAPAHLHFPSASARARLRNQENSEEANMRQFETDIATLRERENSRSQEQDTPGGVLDDTPPRSLDVERYMRNA